MRSARDVVGLQRDISLFRDSMVKFTGLLAGKGVKVVFRGGECHTDGETIVLPAIEALEACRDQDQARRFIENMVGYVNHEVSHVLFTDFEEWQDRLGAPSTTPQLKALSNVLEDARVEARMRELWRGTGENFDRYTRSILETQAPYYATKDAFTQLCLLYSLLIRGESYDFAHEFFDPQLVDWAKKHLRSWVKKARKTRSTEEALDLAMEVYLVIQKAFEPPPPPPPEEEEEDDPEDSEDGEESEEEGEAGGGEDDEEEGEEDSEAEESSDAGEGEDSDDSEEEDGEGSEEGHEDGEGSAEEPEGEDGEDSSEEDDAEAGEDDSEDDSDPDAGGTAEDSAEEDEESEHLDDELDAANGDGDSDGDESADPQDSADDPEGAEAEDATGAGELQDLADGSVKGETDADVETDAEEQMEKRFRELARWEADGTHAYAVYTTEGDYVGPILRDSIAHWRHYYRLFEADPQMDMTVRYLQEQVEGAVGPLRSSLARVLKARGTAYTVRDLDRGKLDRSRLWRLPVTPDTATTPRVYKQDVVAQTYNLAVIIAINESGSMAHSADPAIREISRHAPGDGFLTRMDMAAAAGLALGDVLHALRIPFGIFGHTTGGSDAEFYRGNYRFKEAKAKYAMTDQLFCRYGDITIEWVKDFQSTWTARRRFMGGLYFQGNTYDAEVVRYATRTLCQRPEVTRRILIMLDDGYPMPDVVQFIDQHQEALKKAVGEAETQGVEVLGVGMACDISSFYPNNVTVNDVQQLPQVLLTQFGKMLGVKR